MAALHRTRNRLKNRLAGIGNLNELDLKKPRRPHKRQIGAYASEFWPEFTLDAIAKTLDIKVPNISTGRKILNLPKRRKPEKEKIETATKKSETKRETRGMQSTKEIKSTVNPRAWISSARKMQSEGGPGAAMAESLLRVYYNTTALGVRERFPKDYKEGWRKIMDMRRKLGI